MSHLTATRHVRITPGGSAIHPGAGGTGPAEPDTSWDGMVRDLTTALELDADTAGQFTTALDEAVEALALVAGLDLEVARTKIRGALLGDTGMVTATIPLDLTDGRLDGVLAGWDVTDPTDADRVMARLAVLHQDLVNPTDPTGGGDQAGEGQSGSGPSLPTTPGPAEVEGQAGYTLDSVPVNAADVVAWISDAPDNDDARARAEAALEVEEAREADHRKTVMAAIEAALDG